MLQEEFVQVLRHYSPAGTKQKKYEMLFQMNMYFHHSKYRVCYIQCMYAVIKIKTAYVLGIGENTLISHRTKINLHLRTRRYKKWPLFFREGLT
jgi:hypothetical protein